MPAYDDQRDFRERVRFERRRENGDDGYGNVQYEWQRIAGPCAARIRPISGAETADMQGLAGVGTFEVIVRASSGAAQVGVGDRCVNERSGRLYNIRSIMNIDERGRFLTIECMGGVAI